MNRYFRVQAATDTDLIFAYCGDDQKNSLEGPLPPDAQSQGTFKMPPGLTKSQIEQFLANSFINLAFSLPTSYLLVRLDGNNAVTFWVQPQKK